MGGGEEVVVRGGKCVYIGMVLCLFVGDVWGNKWEVMVGIDWEVGGWVDEVFVEDVVFFYEGVEVVFCGVNGDLFRVVMFIRVVD